MKNFNSRMKKMDSRMRQIKKFLGNRYLTRLKTHQR